MLIAHVVPTPFGGPGLYGGGERFPLELSRALSRHVPCRLITFGDRPMRAREDDLEIVVLRTILRLKGHPVHPISRGLAVELRDADIVHTHQTRSAPSALSALLSLLQNKPVVTTDHGLGPSRLTLAPRLFERFLLVSHNSAETMRAPPEKTRVILGGVDVDRFHPQETARSGVLYAGRITPHKGLDRLIRALPSGVGLRIAGTTGHDTGKPERDYPNLLRDLAKGQDVTFCGRVGDDSLAELHCRAQVFVLPSVDLTVYGKRVAISELLGLSVLEAMASGTPVVASRIGGLPEVIRHGETGYLVAPGDVEELRSRIGELLGDAQKARRMGLAGRRLAVEHFTWEHCARRCLSAYEEILSMRPK
ncbi:MAG: glycosyltransferase family 4 protein [Actinomycetota bacterium]|nr:glycosyltransferase family 4 protein [Actinomycetota bacterium]